MTDWSNGIDNLTKHFSREHLFTYRERPFTRHVILIKSKIFNPLTSFLCIPSKKQEKNQELRNEKGNTDLTILTYFYK